MSEHFQKLTPEEFNLAIKRGQGRALYHALKFGIDDVAEFVLQACVTNQVYDGQSEDERATWLYQMFRNTPYYVDFSNSIINALSQASEFWDIVQLCDLTTLLAQEGNDSAKQALRTLMLKHLGEQDFGATEWVKIEGINGLLELATLYGQRYLSDSNFTPNTELLLDFKNDSRLEEFTQTLLSHAEHNAYIEAYVAFLKQNNKFPPFKKYIKQDPTEIKNRQRERMRQSISIKTILEDARAKQGSIPGRYATFGKFAATQEELEQLFIELLQESDDEVCLRLLWIFSLVPLPRLSDKLWTWTNSSNDEIRNAALWALSNIKHQDIHTFARAKLEAGWFLGTDISVIELLKHNFEPSDGALLYLALKNSNPNWEELHSIGSQILDIAKIQNHESLADALQWVYEMTPCSNCRKRSVEALQVIKKLEKPILLECLFDSDRTLKELAKQQLIEIFGYHLSFFDNSLQAISP